MPAFWLRRGLLAYLLWPISLLFNCIAALRRRCLVGQRLPVPVVVVGGITIGGAGKTPLVLWLVEALRARGYVPGIISRGYGGAVAGVSEVGVNGDPRHVGDEPLLLRQRAGVPVFVSINRYAAGNALLAAYPDTNILLCDDGLQHYALARDVEIVVLDRRGLGNGWCLPAGPLRELPQRLTQIDVLVLNDAPVPSVVPPAVFAMQLLGDTFYRLEQPTVTTRAESLSGLVLHAVAGIGEPQRFFDHLANLGLTATEHAFPDHHSYSEADLQFEGDAILVTEKDAVKLRAIMPLQCPVWVLPVTAQVAAIDGSAGLDQLIVEKLNGLASA